MALTEEQNERVELLLQQLEPEIGKMTGASPGFVRDQIERHAKYGAQMFLSAKQTSWLESLYEKHVGPLNQLEGIRPGELNEKPEPGEPDDDIPF